MSPFCPGLALLLLLLSLSLTDCQPDPLRPDPDPNPNPHPPPRPKAAGVLVPDIPLEETGPIRASATAAGLETVLLVTPTTPVARMALIASASEGFVYLVSLTGVTGVQTSIQSRVQGLIAQLKGVTAKPVAVGFGVSTGAQAEQLVAWGADGVIVGSAFVKALGEAATPKEGLVALEALAVDLRAGIDRGTRAKGRAGGAGAGGIVEQLCRSLGLKKD